MGKSSPTVSVARRPEGIMEEVELTLKKHVFTCKDGS